jgi:hypothetical protein
MFDHSGWHKITCADRDAMVHGDDSLHCFSSLTDLHGAYGEPLVYTEWGLPNPDRAVLRDYRWPDSERPCEHWVPDIGFEVRN